MIMLSYKTRAMGFSGNGQAAGRLLGQLGDGLQLILDALKNYSGAYEALGGQRGMRRIQQMIIADKYVDQIQLAADAVNLLQHNDMFNDQTSM